LVAVPGHEREERAQRFRVQRRVGAVAMRGAFRGGVTPAPRVSPWFGYSPLDPAHVASYDGIVFVKDAPPG
jgi:hypothetical protein